MRLRLTCATAILAVASLSGVASAQPVNGTYQRSCRNAQISGGLLSAECADGNGRFHASSIPYGRCVGDIGNNNGMLNCNGAVASGGGLVSPGNYGPGGNDNGPRGGGDNRGYGGPPPPAYGQNNDRGQPPYPPRDNSGYGPGQFAQGGPDFGRDDRPAVFPEFQPQERHIRMQIRDGFRDDLIAPEDARDLMGQLADIQARELRVYRQHGKYLSADDRRRFRNDLYQLDRLVDRIRNEP